MGSRSEKSNPNLILGSVLARFTGLLPGCDSVIAPASRLGKPALEGFRLRGSFVPAVPGKDWLPDMDLNHDKQIQSLLCYRYTIGQAGAARN